MAKIDNKKTALSNGNQGKRFQRYFEYFIWQKGDAILNSAAS